MTRAQAEQLRADGATFSEIAAMAGVSTSTVYRWLNPEYAESQRAVARRWKASHKGTCVDCGAPTSRGGRPGPATRCRSCADVFYPPVLGRARRGRGPVAANLFAFLAEGERSYAEIRDHLGITSSHACVLLHRQVKYGLVERCRRGVYRLPEAAA